ncbi:MAG: hypothetical protein WCL11_02770, partial [Verrucomicrobiota bacterium]
RGAPRYTGEATRFRRTVTFLLWRARAASVAVSCACSLISASLSPFHPGVAATSCTQATTPNVPTLPKRQPLFGQIYGLALSSAVRSC